MGRTIKRGIVCGSITTTGDYCKNSLILGTCKFHGTIGPESHPVPTPIREEEWPWLIPKNSKSTVISIREITPFGYSPGEKKKCYYYKSGVVPGEGPSSDSNFDIYKALKYAEQGRTKREDVHFAHLSNDYKHPALSLANDLADYVLAYYDEISQKIGAARVNLEIWCSREENAIGLSVLSNKLMTSLYNAFGSFTDGIYTRVKQEHDSEVCCHNGFDDTYTLIPVEHITEVFVRGGNIIRGKDYVYNTEKGNFLFNPFARHKENALLLIKKDMDMVSEYLQIASKYSQDIRLILGFKKLTHKSNEVEQVLNGAISTLPDITQLFRDWCRGSSAKYWHLICGTIAMFYVVTAGVYQQFEIGTLDIHPLLRAAEATIASLVGGASLYEAWNTTVVAAGLPVPPLPIQ